MTVWGAGPVGLFAIQSAKVLGATPSRQGSRGCSSQLSPARRTGRRAGDLARAAILRISS